MMFEDRVTLETSEIGQLLERITAFLEDNGVEMRPTHHVTLIFEEILVNVAMHGGGENQAATVRIWIEPDQVRGEIVDTGRPFDPRSVAEPDVTAGLADRPIGGLGIFLVRRVSSAFSYEHHDGRNHTTFSVPRAETADRGAE